MNKTTSEMKLVPISKLVPYANNARTHSPEQINKLRGSLREFGFVSPVIIDKDYGILAGHGRVMAARAENIEQVPCVFVDHLTEAQKKAYILADNRFALDAGWDEDMLRVEMEALQGMDFDIALTGFDESEIADLLSLDDGEAQEDDFDVDAELAKPCVAKTGDVWHLGKHRVICGDSTLPETFNTLMDGKKANLVLTDPPYNVDVEETAGKIKNDNMSDENFYKFLFAALVNMEQNMEADASIYLFHADTQGLTVRRAFTDAGFYLSGCCIWKKNALVLGRSPYQWIHEPCLFGWKIGGKHQWYSDRKQTTVWEYNRPKASREHPTMKPVALMAYPMKNSCMSNCIVLDPFLGSGSTLIAAEETGRICYGIELDEKFVDVIVWRYMEATGKTDVYVLRDGKKIPVSEIEVSE